MRANQKKLSHNKRISVVKGDYVVVIQIYSEADARFITAYVADNSIEKIRNNPKWGVKYETKKDAD